MFIGLDEDLESLASQILGLAPERRQQLLLTVFGSMLPEVPAQPPEISEDAADSVKYRAQGQLVDQGLFEYVRDNLGIFSAEQLGDADTLLANLEDAQNARADAARLAWTAESYLRTLEHQSNWASVIREVSNFLGARGEPPWAYSLPNAPQLIAAIQAGGWHKGGATPDHDERTEALPVVSDEELLRQIKERMEKDPSIAKEIFRAMRPEHMNEIEKGEST